MKVKALRMFVTLFQKKVTKGGISADLESCRIGD